MHWGQVCGSFLASNENEEVVVFQVCVSCGVEKWKFDLPALFCKVGCDVWCDKEEPKLLFARPECLGLGEHLGSNTGLGFYRKSVLPPVRIYFDHCVGLVVVDSIWFPAYDLRSESCRAQEPLEGCFDQFCVLGFTFHCGLLKSFMFSRCT
jgi:hypothetical protein